MGRASGAVGNGVVLQAGGRGGEQPEGVDAERGSEQRPEEGEDGRDDGQGAAPRFALQEAVSDEEGERSGDECGDSDDGDEGPWPMGIEAGVEWPVVAAEVTEGKGAEDEDADQAA